MNGAVIGGHTSVTNLIGRIDLDVNDRNHRDKHGEDDHSVKVGGQEGSLEPSSGCVKDDTPGDQETSKLKRREGKVEIQHFYLKMGNSRTYILSCSPRSSCQ